MAQLCVDDPDRHCLAISVGSEIALVALEQAPEASAISPSHTVMYVLST